MVSLRALPEVPYPAGALQGRGRVPARNKDGARPDLVSGPGTALPPGPGKEGVRAGRGGSTRKGPACGVQGYFPGHSGAPPGRGQGGGIGKRERTTASALGLLAIEQ